MKILNGKDLSFPQASAGLPNVLEGILQLFQPVTVGIIKNTQVNGYTQTYVSKYILTKGVRIQNPKTTVFTKTGERIWDIQDIFFPRDVELVADDIFLYNKKQYRVVQMEEWTEYGFNKYSVVQDYTRVDASRVIP